VARPQAAEQGQLKHRNRLAEETSPYLLMHAHNPVDWHPWGEEALEKARRENKVIFLSIGYSSCHWCHVMERESFMDEEIAAYLNEHFVCIKLDREERPDVDSIYMLAVQLMTRRGGWPLSAFLTPEAKPFFGGTYFPARDGDRPGTPGFLTVIRRVNEVWNTQRDEIEQKSRQLSDYLADALADKPSDQPLVLDQALLDTTLTSLTQQYDPDYGGFGFDPSDGQRPKFPEPSNLFFLVDQVRHADHAQAREMLENTLQRMAMGGIRDHVSGGFHRYSVDRFWRIPHFEKMLYDNGQLASVYAQAAELTGREDFHRVTDELLLFVQREMTSPEGAFYSALDADSEGEEGKFYRWTSEELARVVPKDQLSSLGPIYALTGPANFEGEFHVPQLGEPLAETARRRGVTEPALDQRLAPLRAALMAARDQRPRPLTDTKVLTSWNGLMIRGFADAGRMLRTFSQGQAKLNAYVDDYAFLVDGLLALHQATHDDRWLQEAHALTTKQIELFWDPQHGGFFFTSNDHESLIARGKLFDDGVRPAGNSVAALNLLYLARAADKPELVEYAEKSIQAARALVQRAPGATPRLMEAAAVLIRSRS
jgi:uncharacterized protein YyaL (SSP411 family)